MPNKPRVPATMLGKVMDLTVKDRLIIIQLLPARATMASQIVAKHILAKVQITDKEKGGIDWQEEAGRARWDEKKSEKIKVKLTSTEIDFLRAQIKEWDEKKTIPMDFVETLLAIQGMSDIPETEEDDEPYEEKPAIRLVADDEPPGQANPGTPPPLTAEPTNPVLGHPDAKKDEEPEGPAGA